MASPPLNWEDIAKEASIFSQIISEEQSLLDDAEPSFLVQLSPASPSAVHAGSLGKENISSQKVITPLKDSTNTQKRINEHITISQKDLNVTITPQKSDERQGDSRLHCPSSAEFNEFMCNIMNVSPLIGDCDEPGSSNSTIVISDVEKNNENVAVDRKGGCGESESKKTPKSHVRKGTFDLDKPVAGVAATSKNSCEENSHQEKEVEEPNVTETKTEVDDLEKFLGKKRTYELLSPPSPREICPGSETEAQCSKKDTQSLNPAMSSDQPVGVESDLRVAEAAAKLADVFDSLEMECDDVFGLQQSDKMEVKQEEEESCEEELLINFDGCSMKKKKLRKLPEEVESDKATKKNDVCDKVCDHLDEKVPDEKPSTFVTEKHDSGIGENTEKAVEKSIGKEENDIQSDCITLKVEKDEHRLVQVETEVASLVENMDLVVGSSGNLSKVSDKGIRKLVEPNRMRRSVSDLSTNAGNKLAPRRSTSGLPMKAPNTKPALMRPGQIQSKLQLKRPSVGTVNVKPQLKADSAKIGNSSIPSKTVSKSQPEASTSRLMRRDSLLQPKPTQQTRDTKPQIKSLSKLADQSNGKGKISLLPNGPKIVTKAPGLQGIKAHPNQDNSKTASKIFRKPSLKMIQPPSTRTAANKSVTNISDKLVKEVSEPGTTAGQVTSSPLGQLMLPVIDGSKTVTKQPSNEIKKTRGSDQAVDQLEQGKTITRPAKKKGPAPVKAIIPMAGSRTVTKEPLPAGSRTVTKPSTADSFAANADVSLDTPMKSDKFLVPKRLSNVFHTPKKTSEKGDGGMKKSSFIPTPTRLNRNSSDSSSGSTPGRGFRKPSSLSSNGSPFPGRKGSGDDSDAFRPRQALVQNTPEVEIRRQSMWSPVKKNRGVSAEDMAFQCTKRIRGGQD